MTTREDKIRGFLLGGAIGDAMGWPVEFLKESQIHKKYGTDGVREPPEDAEYTDDTQMTLRVAEGIIAAAADEGGDVGYNNKLYEKSVAEQIALWRKEDPPRGPGSSCMMGADNIIQGRPPAQCGNPDGKGCGTVMRSAPYGVLEEGPRMAAYHARMTHLMREPAAGAAALAVGVHGCLSNYPLNHILYDMIGAAEEYCPVTARKIRWAWALARSKVEVPTKDVVREWLGWCADDAIAASVFCFIRYRDNYAAAIRAAVNSPGDSDSLGSITGNLVGAWHGVSCIPKGWIERIENREYIEDVAQRLSAV